MDVADESIIEGCVSGKRSAQSALYRKYSPVMMAVCMRYAQTRIEAEDILQEAFLKIFDHIGSFRREGSFEGWMKRIMINHALNHFRKNRRIPFHEDIDTVREEEATEGDDHPEAAEHLTAEKLTALVQTLPPGYRMVFNLYVFEEYSHKDISRELNISENTSKTQLLKARRMLRKKLAGMDPSNKTVSK